MRVGALGAVAPRGALVGAGTPARGAAAAGAAAGRGTDAGATAGLEPAAPGPPGGNVGSLMVGAAEGLGGNVMRTVSFLG